MKKKVLIAVIFCLPWFRLLCQETGGKLPFSFYAGLKAEYFTLGNAFDGKSYFVTDEATMFIPEIEPGFAFGTQFGLKFKTGSWDMGYQYSSNPFSHSDVPDGTLHVQNIKLLGLTFYLTRSEKIKPYVVTDASMSWFRIANGATGRGSYNGQTGKSYFSAVVLGLGAGVEWQISDKIFFRLEGLPELFKITNVKGITKEYWDVKKFSCLKLNASAGLYLALN